MSTNIVLIHKSGGDFRIADAYLLVSHINRYWEDERVKPNIYCYSDAVTREVSVVGLTIRPLPNPEWPGWWAKMNLFSDELKELRPFLYLDLDTAVLKSIQALFPPEKAINEFVTLRDFYRPNKLASGLMWIPAKFVIDIIYSKWEKNIKANIKKFKGDQNFIESVVGKPDLYWQDISQPDFITTFKPKGIWRTELPTNSAVVCFHGVPRIPVAAKSVEWVKSYVSYEI